ncbi:MAG: DUF502 domain-containing protein [Planctomycetota bacterium]
MAKEKRLRDKYRGAFFSGLAALLPTILTLFVLVFCFNFLNDKVAQPINGVIATVMKTPLAKEWYWDKLLNRQEWQLDEVVTPEGTAQAQELGIGNDVPFSEMVDASVPRWLGFLIALLLVLAVGLLFRGYLGRQLWRALESGIQKVPVLKVIYPYAKQVSEFFFAEKKQIHYQTAVAIEYPRRGLWSLGFVTSEGFRDIEEVAGETVVAVFIPSSPTPVTGYTIMVPKDQVIKIDVAADEALRFTMSAGVIQPPSQLPALNLKTRKIERPLAGPDDDAATASNQDATEKPPA